MLKSSLATTLDGSVVYLKIIFKGWPALSPILFALAERLNTTDSFAGLTIRDIEVSKFQKFVGWLA